MALLVTPFNSHASNEITRAPKIYSFGTSFICFAKGWQVLRPVDRSILWEHLVLNDLAGMLQYVSKIDFVIDIHGSKQPTAIECTWNHKSALVRSESIINENMKD